MSGVRRYVRVLMRAFVSGYEGMLRVFISGISVGVRRYTA